MSAEDLHEAVWESVPEGLAPADFALRRDFLLAAVAPGDRVLDVGCGEGAFTVELLRVGARALGVDVASEPLRRARVRHPELELAVVPANGPWTELEDSSFDVVWAGEVIEHVADTAAWLSEVRRVLRSGGLLLLSTPAHTRLSLLRLALGPRRSFAERFDPLGEHVRFYSAGTLTELLDDFGFRDVSVRAAGGVPGFRRALLASAVRARF